MNKYSAKVLKATATALMQNAMFIEDMLHKEEFVDKLGDLDFNMLVDLNNILGYVYFIVDSILEGDDAIFDSVEGMQRLAHLNMFIDTHDPKRLN